MATPTPALGLQDLLDRAAISDVVLNYATGVDRRDWTLYRSVFADMIDIDFTGWLTQEAVPADEWVATVRGTLACFDATQHNMTNPVIRIEGDRAEITVSMVAQHYFDGEMQMLGGFYTDQMARTTKG